MNPKDLKKRKEVKQPESPIEWKLIPWLNKYRVLYVCQYEIPPYRVDFAIPDLKVIVECDGREFHTGKEQRERDKKRDEFMEALGWRVLRFTGSEIHKYPSDCVKKIISCFYKKKENRQEMKSRAAYDMNEIF